MGNFILNMSDVDNTMDMNADGPTRNPNYFDQDYRPASIGLGFIWFFGTIWPLILYAIVRPGKDCYAGGWCWWWNTKGTWHAWHVMRISNGLFYGMLTLFW